jgi:2-dehydro-3-deoxyphosphogluconate aldolase / (4S)-4-hydroxy-2-oxoglutarate aldolase
MTPLIGHLTASPVIPLIQADNVASAIAIAQALQAAGMPLVEVVQRTDQSLQCLEGIANALPDLVVGAGTVLSSAQAASCADAGAKFIVSPGLDEGVVNVATARGLDAIPGVMTPTELQHAHNLGLRTVKFFPASTAGGIGALNALASVFRDMRFIPTGGVSAADLGEYLSQRSVIACGGSWMTPRDAIATRDFERVTALAAEALEIARNAKASRGSS